ncbi:hypothetical protein [Streptomyces sp. H39-S7]|uniref:hypothetical protein n=1 Tax=Streptomyces sp. H39-S7 TaxID=3004357 RepID=UPI0022AF58F8|nr:hypothetical protein [Streptomyces sp. H39-S7]MCZ4124154.1 hypothetical protein [Streptomyces sp. H39-S7]
MSADHEQNCRPYHKERSLSVTRRGSGHGHEARVCAVRMGSTGSSSGARANFNGRDDRRLPKPAIIGYVAAASMVSRTDHFVIKGRQY